jgi:lipopolysaccharide assembly protein A
MSFKYLVALILLGLFIIVSIQNVEVIPVHFLFWKIEISKLLLLILTLVIGILVGMIIPGLLKKPKKEEKIESK